MIHPDSKIGKRTTASGIGVRKTAFCVLMLSFSSCHLGSPDSFTCGAISNRIGNAESAFRPAEPSTCTTDKDCTLTWAWPNYRGTPCPNLVVSIAINVSQPPEYQAYLDHDPSVQSACADYFDNSCDELSNSAVEATMPFSGLTSCSSGLCAFTSPTPSPSPSPSPVVSSLSRQRRSLASVSPNSTRKTDSEIEIGKRRSAFGVQNSVLAPLPKAGSQ